MLLWPTRLVLARSFRNVPLTEVRQCWLTAFRLALFGILTPLHAGFIPFSARGDFLCHLLQLSLFGRACRPVSAAYSVQLSGFQFAVFCFNPIHGRIPFFELGGQPNRCGCRFCQRPTGSRVDFSRHRHSQRLGTPQGVTQNVRKAKRPITTMPQ